MVLMKIVRRAQFTTSRQASKKVIPLRREKHSFRVVFLMEGL
jgi:hypothetical protein